MPTPKLDDATLATLLRDRPAWTLRGDRIARTFRFASFVEAFGFMTAVALIAERANHHPEWRNVYGTVDVELTTHDAGGVTERDLELAAEMDRLAGRFGAG